MPSEVRLFEFHRKAITHLGWKVFRHHDHFQIQPAHLAMFLLCTLAGAEDPELLEDSLQAFLLLQRAQEQSKKKQCRKPLKSAFASLK